MPNFKAIVTVTSLCFGLGLLGYSAVSVARLKGVMPELNLSLKETVVSLLPKGRKAPQSTLLTVLPAALEGCTEGPALQNLSPVYAFRSEEERLAAQQDLRQREAAARLIMGSRMNRAGFEDVKKIYVCGDQKIAVRLTRRPDTAQMGGASAIAVNQAGFDPLQRQSAFLAAMRAMNPVFAEVEGVEIRFDVEAMDQADEERWLGDGTLTKIQDSLAAGHLSQAEAHIGDRYEFSLVSDASEDVLMDFLSRVQFARLVEAAETGGVLAAVAPEEAETGLVKRFAGLLGLGGAETPPVEEGEPVYQSECRTVQAKKICSVVVRTEP